MSSLINIYIPKHPETVTGKTARYIAADVVNRAAQIGGTVAGSAIRTSLYGGTMRPSPIFDGNLRTVGGSKDNNIILHTKKGILGVDDDLGIKIEFVNAQINAVKKNTIVSTALVNRAGKVKERIQADDYDVTISGSLMAETSGVFPYEELKRLNQILNEAESIFVASKYLEIFEINKLALKSADFDQNNLRLFNVMPFTLKFDSDMDYDFLISE